MKLIETFEEACIKLGYEAVSILPDFSMFPEHHRDAMQKHAELVIMIEALNHGVEGKPIYYPVFRKRSPSGVGFAFYYYVGWIAHSSVGARLCLKNRELAIHAGKTFIGHYKAYHLLVPCEG